MPLSRKKSCVPCRRAKARCDLVAPSCSRCRLRNHSCAYEGEKKFSPLLWPSNISEEQFLTQMQDVSTGGDALLTSTVTLDTPPGLDWLNDDVDFTQTIKPFEPQILSMPSHQTDVLPLVALDGDDVAPDAQVHATLPISVSPTCTGTGQIQASFPRQRGPLQRRQILKHCVLTSVIVGQMTSYPKMMIEGDILPPFIVPPCFSREDMAPDCAESAYHRCLPSDLSICQSLVRMYYERTKANAAFVWKSIYAECERLHADHASFDINQQLIILQALTVYVLLQAEDGSSAEANGANRLLGMIMEVAWSVSETIVWSGEVSRNRPERADWIYSESLGRIMILLGSLDLLLDGIRPPSDKLSTVCGGFCAFPLPCHRDLWLARSNRAWRAAYDRCLASRKGTKILTAAELIHYDSLGFLDRVEIGEAVPSDVLDIARWAEGLDALGTLVWMILPFQKWRRNEIEDAW